MTLIAEQLVEDMRRKCSLIVADFSLMKSGDIRVATGLLYPDGSNVDIYVSQEMASFEVSDYGATSDWLVSSLVKPWSTKKRQRMVDSAIRIYGVHKRGGELVRYVENPADVPLAIFQVAQACVRVADLVYTRRSLSTSTFSEQVEEFISDTEIPYESDVELPGQWNNKVSVEFLVQGPRPSAILTLSGSVPAQTHTPAVMAFAKWSDLAPDSPVSCLTIIEGPTEAFRPEDIHRLASRSDVLPFADRSSILDYLRNPPPRRAA